MSDESYTLPNGEDIPFFDADDPDLIKKLSLAMSDLSNVTNRHRPYGGQSHTNRGERGRQEIRGVTMRDVYDCIVIAFVQASAADDEDWLDHIGPEGKCPFAACQRPDCKLDRGEMAVDDVYRARTEKVDPIAVAQCATVELEKRMGIYPNTEALESGDD